ncbi:HD domain-containing protein [Chloroflexales bacterium ZM16-3]|nr:HD domain-containing protein [Chloroflexales bacterium ZM16-3]
MLIPQYPDRRLAAQPSAGTSQRAHTMPDPAAEHMPEQIVRGLGQLLAAHDPHTAAHAERVASLAVRIARSLGLDAADVAIIRQAALLHDIGKLALSAALLERRTPREQIDEARVRRHPTLGARLLIALGISAQVAELVRAHHERWDGAGYPDGLARADIPLGARVIAVADVYDSLTHPRPGPAPLPTSAAASVLLSDGGQRLDPDLVMALLDSLCLR